MIAINQVKYKFFWKGRKKGESLAGILVAEEFVENVVKVSRLSERCITVKLAVGRRLMNVVSAYAPQVGRSEAEAFGMN